MDSGPGAKPPSRNDTLVACLPCLFPRYRAREVGGGRATRQPGQIRKEAALTSTDRVARQPPTRFSTMIFGLRPLAAGLRVASSPDGCKNRPMSEPVNPAGPGSGPADAPAGGYRVLARKYRPASFEDLIGQDAMVRTISNAFESGRIPQAWILTGVRGVGKTT